MKIFPRSLAFLIYAGVLAVRPSLAAAEPAAEKLPDYTVTGNRFAAERLQLLQPIEGVTALEVQETVNLVDTEDAVKYLPSIFLRKRNYGDTQAVMASRVWGVSSSARSLIYADGVLLSALIANNNTIGGPRWGLVAPAEIARIDLMYGPFSAAYPGNSMGAVMEITTRQPEKFEASLQQTEAWQQFAQYGTDDDYLTHQTSLTVGDRAGKFSYWVSGNYQDSHSQPLSYVTSATFPANTTGGYTSANKFGQPANVMGASGLLHTRMANGKVKLAYDLAPGVRAAYTFGLWRNDADAGVETYLRDALGAPTFAGLSGFASGNYVLDQQHTAQSLSLQAHPAASNWSLEAAASYYEMNEDKQRTPSSASSTGTTFSKNGRIAVLAGTRWSTADVKATWQPGGKDSAHSVSFGVHDDYYRLYNPTYNTSDWQAGGPYTSVASEGDGKTNTQAVWAQDTWQLNPTLKLLYGARYEWWHAYDGYNANGATVVRQAEVRRENFSPKASLVWSATREWTVTASLAQAYRYATAAELYQLVTTGNTFTSPNPDLKPDDVLAAELRVERTTAHGRVRVSLFQDDIHDAIISQFKTLVPGSSTFYNYISNVDHVRARGVELVLEQRDLLTRGLDFSGSVTYVDAKTLATSGLGQFGSAVGKPLPNIPEWRATFLITYRPDERWAFSAGGRYSDMMYTTLDAADTNPNTYGGFAAWFVADLHVNCRINRRWNASLGCDNVLNRKYFLFHPFPQRTLVGSLKFAF
jgi:iron complex outermembrane receptor protein